MSISSHASSSGNEVVIEVAGRFDFSTHREFRAAYRNMSGSMTYRVDLAMTDYMDSSALGMLLLLRKHAGGDSARIILNGVPENVKKVLSLANFDKLFEIT